MTTAHDFEMKDIDGHAKKLADYAGKVLLVVNVASRCGYTPHYAGLEKLYRERKDAGLVVLGIPCNQFGEQEPGTEVEIKAFCQTNYDVTFPLFAKVDVNGPNRAPLYAWLAGAEDIKWNFVKFVVGRDGNVVARFSHKTKPDDTELRAKVDEALGK